MLETKKSLRRHIVELENELEAKRQVERINVFVKKADLPKCESRICRGCAYAAKEITPWGQIVFQGCTKDLECKCFIPETKIVLLPNSTQWLR